MSELVDLRRELDRWKDKYFTQSEAFDEEKGFAQEYANLLQRLIIRISLAAENVSDELDRELDALRTVIRSANAQDNDLEKRLKRIDKLILQTDESKQENAEKVLEALESMIQQLQTVKGLPRKQKSELKKLSKSLAKRAINFKEYPGILTEYAVVQAEALKQIVNDEAQEEGFFSRFLGGSKSAPTPETIENEGDSKEREITEISVEEAELEVISESSEVAVKEEFVPGFASISGHITATINGLLEQLVFPDSAQRDLQRLQAKLSSKLNWYELGPTLDDLANLVIAVVGKGQRDFERFLLVLDERLQEVQTYLTNTTESELAWQKKTNAFSESVRTEVTSMTKDLSDANDIEQLKASISGHIDAISGVMTQFSKDGESYQQNREDEVAILKERLAEMEAESTLIKAQLKEERGRALRDALTGLPNREAYDEQLELALARFHRYGTPATLVVADVDHFKSVNDTYGHLSGDKVLQIIAKELTNRIRKTDFVARYGGEEFAIILPDAELSVAEEVMNKTREMISRLPFHFRDERVQITMSFGLVAFDKDRSKEALFEAADRALYAAKENGRNRVEIAGNE